MKRSFIICTVYTTYGDKIKENVMGGLHIGAV
jgi:hypothetical protein